MKRKLTHFEQEISKILRKDWNPIGFDEDLPDDEYARYAPRLYELISENCNAYVLALTLSHISYNVIGCRTEWFDDIKVAEKLITELQSPIIEDIEKKFRKRYKDTNFKLMRSKIPGTLYDN